MKLKIFEGLKKRKGQSRVLLTKKGQLYFSKGAMSEFGLKGVTYIKIAQNEEEKSDKNVYILLASKDEPNTGKLNATGYIDASNFFDSIGHDYLKNPASYTISKDKYQGADMLILRPSTAYRRKTK